MKKIVDVLEAAKNLMVETDAEFYAEDITVLEGQIVKHNDASKRQAEARAEKNKNKVDEVRDIVQACLSTKKFLAGEDILEAVNEKCKAQIADFEGLSIHQVRAKLVALSKLGVVESEKISIPVPGKTLQQTRYKLV